MNKYAFIIDDDKILRLILQKMIQITDPNFQCIQCEDGLVGLNAIKNLENKPEKIIILLDINMPVMDGWGFLDSFREIDPSIASICRIFIVSSSTDNSDIEKSKEYAVVEKFYHKPLSKDDIKSILE